MATVKAFIRATSANKKRIKIRFRLSDGRQVQLFHVSELEIEPAVWDSKKEAVKTKVLYDPDRRRQLAIDIAARKDLILEIYNSSAAKGDISSVWLEEEIERRTDPRGQAIRDDDFFSVYEDFIDNRDVSQVRKNNVRVVIRALRRYEAYRRAEDKGFTMRFAALDADMLRGIEDYLKNEHLLCVLCPEICERFPEKREQKPRGQNTINGMMSKLRTFVRWAYEAGYVVDNPFARFKIKESVYGTPYYITVEERNKLYNTDLSQHPRLAEQRDVFVFQCLIGCRVSDLYGLTMDNIIDGAVEYIPAKTKEGRPHTVRVPLNAVAREIVERYADVQCDGGAHDQARKPLFSFISEQKYNQAIKRMFLSAGLTRPVTVLNQTTRQPQVRPLNEIASSHLARRCFIGNLYKQVKDPNLVGALSGHKEGSRAFSRYRTIDEDMKRDLVKLLE